jgi:ketosteroid isomerase-like protein
MRLAFATFFIISLASFSAFAQSKVKSGDEADSQSVQKAAAAFINAFNNLEWEDFRNSFADDATVFFPSNIAYRADGRAEIEAGFEIFFDEGRKGRSGPPYLNIKPKDIKIQVFREVAVMTFHLERQSALGRRTIIWRKQKGKWLIVHMHASGIELPKNITNVK